ncbi:MAG: AbrB family transcriptional regulator [Dehalobacterium sp.]
MWAPFLETLLVAVAGGFVFQLIHFPLPWMLGPLLFVLVWTQVLKHKTWWHVNIRNFALVILGYTIGNSFSPAAGGQILRQLPSMLICTIATVFASLLIAFIISRKTGVSLSTSIIGSIPGGLPQMVTLSEEVEGTDISNVIFMQTMRVLSVVFFVPFLVIHRVAGSVASGNAAGGTGLEWNLAAVNPGTFIVYLVVVLSVVYFSVRVKVPTPFLTGPILGVALLNMLGGGTGPEMPRLVIIGSQLSMGVFMGQSIQITSLSNWKQMLTYTLAGSFSLVFFSLGLGELLSRFHSIELVSAFLGTAPGGVAEMGLTAIQVHADLSLVSSYQIFRVFFTIFVVPPLLKRFLKKMPLKKEDEDSIKYNISH